MSNGAAYVHTNDVALRRIALQNIRRSSWTLNCLALHEIFRCCGESSSLIVAWREGYLAETTENTNCKGNDDLLGGMTSSNVKIGAKPSHGGVFTSLCRFYLPITIPKQDVSFAALMAVIARDFRPKINFWLVIKTFLRTLASELHFPQGKLSFFSVQRKAHDAEFS